MEMEMMMKEMKRVPLEHGSKTELIPSPPTLVLIYLFIYSFIHPLLLNERTKERTRNAPGRN